MMEAAEGGGKPSARRRPTVVEGGVLEVRLLGPLDVVDGEQVLTPHRQKPRALLAALALRVGRPVSKDVLVEDLWGEEPPRRATDALENYVSQLRKQIGRESITTLPAGYALDLGPEQVDAVRFERHIVEARGMAPMERAEGLRSALALLRGPPLADLAFEPFAGREIARLEELELAAREELTDAELALGRHVDVIPDLEALVAAQPYRERPRALLMLALYRSGRQAEALATYQDLRRLLVDELGIDPADELRSLEQAILRQDESLRAPPRTERSEPTVALGAPSARPSRKVVTMLASSVVDPDARLGTLDPELLRSLLDRYLAAVETCVERHGGTTARVAGDDLVAVFGVPAVHEDDALRAVRAAIDMRQAIVELNDELVAERGVFLQTRTGIDTGEVLVTDSPLPTGRPIAGSSALAAEARAGQIVVGERTRGLVRDTVETEELDDLPGRFRVVALVPGASGRTLRLDAPLVGRARQLEALERAFAAAVDGRSCHLFTVLGAAGVGKSRLVRELAERVGDAARVLRGRCLPYGEGITYLPLLEGLPDDVATELEPGEADEHLRRRIRAELEALARERPLVLVLDDLHWAEPALLDLVEDVASTSREAPLFVVCLARPELLEHRPAFGGGVPNASTVLLEPLDDSDSERLVDHLLGASDLPEIVRAHIVSVAEGNPLFVEELLTMLVDRAVLQQLDGRWTTTETVIPVPGSVQALIAARIDRLPEGERLVLELASIEGKRFTRALVAGLAADERPLELDAHLDALVRAELVRPRADGDFTFRHQLFRDEVYASMTKQARAERHERLADLLAIEDDTASAELVGYHREQARRLRSELGPAS